MSTTVANEASTRRASERSDRRDRIVQLTAASTLFTTEQERRCAGFVADAVSRRADGEFIGRHPSEAFPGHIRNALDAVAVRQRGEIKVGCSRPEKAKHGYELPLIVLETCMDDQPFIVDTIKLVLKQMDVHVLGTLNMILPIERDGSGKLLDVSQDNPRSRPESFSCHLLSVASVGDRAGEIRDAVRWHLERARTIAGDFRQMRKLVRDLAHDLAFAAEGTPDGSDLREATAFGEWLIDDNFVFMGAYGFDEQHRPTGRLGLGRYDEAAKAGIEGDPQVAFAPGAPLVSIHQSRLASPIHRDAPMVEIRLRLVDETGQGNGGVVFVGLFTYKAVMGRASTVPFLRRRLAAMVAAEDLVPASHRLKVFLSFFDRLPLAFLFAADDKAVAEVVNEAIDVDFGGAPRVFYRLDEKGTGAQVFVMISQERYGEDVRLGAEDRLRRAFGADEVRFRMLVGKTDTVVLDYLLFGHQKLTAPSVDALADQVSALVSPWLETMRELLRGQDVAEAEVDRLCLLYGESLPEVYRHRVEGADLVDDFAALGELAKTGKPQLRVRCDARDQAAGFIRLICFGATDTALTDILPVLDYFGLRVQGESTWPIADSEGGKAYYETYTIAADKDNGPHLLDHRTEFLDALEAVLDGRMNSAPLNRLLLPARLDWRQLQMMRAYLGYARQLGTAFPANLVQTVLLNQPALARTIVELFNARFEPRLGGVASPLAHDAPARVAQVAAVRETLQTQLRGVQDAVEDKVIRMFANFVMATLRTNYFQRPDDFRALSFKFRCADVELMPEPRPMFEIWVYDPRVEGIHLRGGKVARGGLRWSDRIDDFRTEILGLMQTQMVKNTLIVPVGSKGGFVLKKPEKDDQARRKQADELYKVFISGLLDLTDNLVGGKTIAPDDVVVFDEPDPYLVVAADKGTAHLSDTANGLALARGFWLGDAFASGGSVGYDHKLYGITAKGGWVCVQRHFREMGIDTQKDVFTVTGIGDMSGDVFGNGLLLSHTIKLVAAFDHRHIFLDPNPDPEASWQERKRLFDTPRSSWAMYDAAKISQGGGVYPRTAKSVPISPEMQAVLGVTQAELSGEDLMRAIILAEVDLFWNGGIGTFVKASHETNADVGDRSNDAIRVDATQLRCKVVGEGGNLGFTQAARVEFALRGGRVNTDAVDNSAGVDLSDHEVNLKILFAPLMQSGAIQQPERDKALFTIDHQVCDLVLYNNYQQSLGISVAEMRSPGHLRVWGDVVRFLVEELGIDQQVQMLPSKQTIADRRKAGLGLTRPELARITAFAKMWIYNAMVADRGCAKAVEQRWLNYYFPQFVREHYAKAIDGHMLRHEIVCTLWTNELVDFGTATLIPRLSMEFDRPVLEVCQAHAMAVDLLGLPALRKAVTDLDGQVAAHVQYEAIAALEDAAAATTHWLLSQFPGEQLAKVLARGDEVRAFVAAHAAALVAGQTHRRRAAAHEVAQAWKSAKMPAGLADAVAGRQAVSHAVAVWWLAQESGAAAEAALGAYFGTAEVTGFDEVLHQIAGAPVATRWEVAAMQSLGQDLGYTLYRLSVRVAQALKGKATSEAAVRAVLVDELKLGSLWELVQQILADGVQIPALVVLTERLRARLR